MEKFLLGFLFLVDLAGNEKPDQLDVALHKEGISINESLSFLQHIILEMKAKPLSVGIPYRQSELTTLLRPALGIVLMFLLLTC